MQIIKRMQARYHGRCSCGQAIEPGQIIGYSRDGGRRSVLCPACFAQYAGDDDVTAYDGGLYVRGTYVDGRPQSFALVQEFTEDA